MKKIIEKIFKNNKIELNFEKIDKFSLFFDILIENNKKFNLTRIIKKENVVKKHFLDSIMANNFIKFNSTIIDVGTGAGFPSVPLKIYRNDLNFVLVDSVNKKIEFLNSVIKDLNLQNIKTIHDRCEDLAHKIEYRENFDVCVSRAVAEMNILCEYCLPFVKIGGIFISYKSENIQEELEKAQKAIDILGGKIKEIFIYDLDGERKNSLVIIEKIRRTPKQFPRRNNKPRSIPIL